MPSLPIVRRVMAVIVAGLLLLSGPVAAGLAAERHHGCHVPKPHCGHVPSVACCDHEAAPSPTTPAQNHASVGRVNLVKMPASTPAVALGILGGAPSASDLRAFSPAHGHHSANLSILFGIVRI